MRACAKARHDAMNIVRKRSINDRSASGICKRISPDLTATSRSVLWKGRAGVNADRGMRQVAREVPAPGKAAVLLDAITRGMLYASTSVCLLHMLSVGLLVS